MQAQYNITSIWRKGEFVISDIKFIPQNWSWDGTMELHWQADFIRKIVEIDRSFQLGGPSFTETTV